MLHVSSYRPLEAQGRSGVGQVQQSQPADRRCDAYRDQQHQTDGVQHITKHARIVAQLASEGKW